MGRVQERLDRLDVQVRSPDGRIVGFCEGRGEFRLGFADEDAWNEFEDVPQLATQMEHALDALSAAVFDARRDVVADIPGMVADPGAHWDARRRRYRDELGKIHAVGEVPDGSVRLEAIGLRDWHVALAADVFEELSPESFCGEFDLALADLRRDHAVEVDALRQEVYGHDGA